MLIYPTGHLDNAMQNKEQAFLYKAAAFVSIQNFCISQEYYANEPNL
jgi:hypothetical protein